MTELEELFDFVDALLERIENLESRMFELENAILECDDERELN